MKEFLSILESVQETPIPVILIGGGILFLFVAVGGQLGAKVSTDHVRPRLAATIGGILLVIGTVMYLAPLLKDSAETAPVTTSGTPGDDASLGTPAANHALVNETTTATPTATPTEHVATVSPDEFVKGYYSAINDRRYAETWAQLSVRFKDEFNSDQDGNHDFGSYIEWWDSVERVDVGDARIVLSDDASATVFAQISYRLKSGSRQDDPRPYIMLIRDSSSESWLIDDKESSP